MKPTTDPITDPARPRTATTDPKSLEPSRSVSAFVGHRQLTSGTPFEVATAIERDWSKARNIGRSILPMGFDDLNGRQVDIDPGAGASGIAAQIARQITPAVSSSFPASKATGTADEGTQTEVPRGRPRLGVVAREVTLLPRHWDWLNTQRGGASAALRRLVDEARKRLEPEDRRREAREAIWRFATAINGNAVGFEEAMRALFAGDAASFAAHITDWPPDVIAYLQRFTENAFE